MPFFGKVLSQVPQRLNWEGSHTLSKKEKRNRIMSQRKRRKIKCVESLKFSFSAVTLRKASFILLYFSFLILTFRFVQVNIICSRQEPILLMDNPSFNYE